MGNMKKTVMPITIDGELREIQGGSSIQQALNQLELNPSSIQLATGQLIPAARFRETPVPHGFTTHMTPYQQGG